MRAEGDLSRAPGVGLKPQHVESILEDRHTVGWFEIHAENYMGAGGPPHARLDAIRARYPLSVHGVGLSIGGADAIDRRHLARLNDVVERYEPALVSEHLAWSTHQGRYFNDLLALPYTKETLQTACDHIDVVQNFLGRRILLENPSTYVRFDESTIDEPTFIADVIRRTGCGLLLDVNNVHVTCTNHGWDSADYMRRIPAAAVGEIHLAGHAEERDEDGQPILIDTHDRRVSDNVWALYALAVELTGPVPVLIEWDNEVPDWSVLADEAASAHRLARRHVGEGMTRHVA